MILHGDVKVCAAFVKARGEMAATVAKDKKGNYGQYATLAALTEATTEPLARHGCAIVQEASLSEQGVLVETWLVHESGGMLQFTPLTMPVKDRTAQSVGSAITYARRYALAAVCGIAPDDDDGEAATHGKQPVKPQQAAPRPNVAPGPAAQATQPTAQDARTPLAENTLKRLHVVGSAFYGTKESWDEARPGLVNWASKGAVESSSDLTENEATALIAALEKKIAAQAQQKFDAPTPAERGARPAGSAAMRARIQGQPA